MTVSIYALKRGLADVAIPVGDETLNVTYRPGVITPGFNEAHWFDPAGWVSLAVERWDLDDAGDTVPLRTVERDAAGRETSKPAPELLDLPNDFLLLVQREINRDLLPGKRLRGTSAAGSKPEAR